jgi:hypothetical protein
LPKLFVIPPQAEIAGNEPAIRAAAKTYFEGIAAYSACLQAELVAAGGESAPAVVRQVLILRNNAAVEEADYMMKRFTDTFGAAAQDTPLPQQAATPAAR